MEESKVVNAEQGVGRNVTILGLDASTKVVGWCVG